MSKFIKTFLASILSILFIVSGISEVSAQTAVKKAELGPWDWGHIRIVRSNDNIEFLNRLHATVNQNGGPIIFPKNKKKPSGSVRTAAARSRSTRPRIAPSIFSPCIYPAMAATHAKNSGISGTNRRMRIGLNSFFYRIELKTSTFIGESKDPGPEGPALS